MLNSDYDMKDFLSGSIVQLHGQLTEFS